MSRLSAAWRWLVSSERPFRERGMYKSGRPNRWAALLNRGWAIVGEAGLWSNRLITLEVPGRRSGRLVSFPLMVADYEGERYLVAMLGNGANWVRNIRAAGGRVVLRHGRREHVRLEEVDPSARAPIVKRYLQVAPAAPTVQPGESASAPSGVRKDRGAIPGVLHPTRLAAVGGWRDPTQEPRAREVVGPSDVSPRPETLLSHPWGKQASARNRPGLPVVVHSGRLMLDLRDARKQAKGAARA